MGLVVLHRAVIPEGAHRADGGTCPCGPLTFDPDAVGAHPERPWWVLQASGFWRRCDGLEVEQAAGLANTADAITERLKTVDGVVIGEDWA